MRRAITGATIAAVIALAACVTTNHKGYTICGKDYNNVCPDKTANVVVK